MKHKHRLAGYITLAVIILAVVLLSFLFPGLRQFADPEYVRNYLISLGGWGYVMFVVLLVASIPLPIPSAPVSLGGGYVYGIWIGTLLALLAVVLGSAISFFLTRKFGEPLLEKMVDKHHIVHFNHIFKKRGATAALIAFAIPVFPSDAVYLLLGLTRMKYHLFLLLVLIGHIPRFLIINTIGNDLHTGLSLRTVVMLIAGALFILITLFRERIKKLLFKELKEVEREARVIEKDVEKEEKIIGKGLKKEVNIIEREVKKELGRTKRTRKRP